MRPCAAGRANGTRADTMGVAELPVEAVAAPVVELVASVGGLNASAVYAYSSDFEFRHEAY